MTDNLKGGEKENVIKMSQRRAICKLTTFLIVLFCMQHGTAEAPSEMGSILFDDHGFAKKCFVQGDVALLATRMKFQQLLPGIDMLNDDGVQAIVRYFYGINEIIEKMSQDEVRQMVQKSFYDLLGR